MINNVEQRRLGVPLTDEQIIVMSKELSDHCIDKAKTENDKTESNKRFKGIIDHLDGLIEYKSRSVADGFVTVNVECHWIVNPDSQTKVLIRTDTGEQIDEKELEDGEWQEVMPITGVQPDCKDPEQEFAEEPLLIDYEEVTGETSDETSQVDEVEQW